MFTGIVQATGAVNALSLAGKAARLVIDAPGFWADAAIGDSIAVDGVCLTAKEFSNNSAVFDVSKESLDRTVIGGYKPKTVVNLEKALRPMDRLGGHIMQGHVDGLGTYLGKKIIGDNVELNFEIPETIDRYTVEKGSIAINGISLTVAHIVARQITIAVIPHTLAVTNLHTLTPGTAVNMECDIIAKYTEKLLLSGRPQSRIDEKYLKEKGFI